MLFQIRRLPNRGRAADAGAGHAARNRQARVRGVVVSFEQTGVLQEVHFRASAHRVAARAALARPRQRRSRFENHRKQTRRRRLAHLVFPLQKALQGRPLPLLLSIFPEFFPVSQHFLQKAPRSVHQYLVRV